jgi:L-2,4-diaminobutyrate decarboxylase
MAGRIDRCMAAAESLASFVDRHEHLELLAQPETGVVVWRPSNSDPGELLRRLPDGLTSVTEISGIPWLRCVGATPLVDRDAVIAPVSAAC